MLLSVACRLGISGVALRYQNVYGDVVGTKGLCRSYSVANAHREDEDVGLQIREMPDGEMSRYPLHDVEVNDLLRLREPLGTFSLRGQAGKDLPMQSQRPACAIWIVVNAC